jgi:hypothetical protein
VAVERRGNLDAYLCDLLRNEVVALSHEMCVFLSTGALLLTEQDKRQPSPRKVPGVGLGGEGWAGAEKPSPSRTQTQTQTQAQMQAQARAKDEESVPFMSAGVFKSEELEARLFALVEEVFEVDSLPVVKRGAVAVVRRVASLFMGRLVDKKILSRWVNWLTKALHCSIAGG